MEIKAPEIEPSCWVCELIKEKRFISETRNFILLPNRKPYPREDGEKSNHILVFSKRHIFDFDELISAEVVELGFLLKDLARSYKSVNEEFAILLNNKSAKTAPHFHIHALNSTDWKKNLDSRPWNENDLSDEFIQCLQKY